MNNKETSHLDTSLGIFFASQLHQFQCSTAATYTLKSRATTAAMQSHGTENSHLLWGACVLFSKGGNLCSNSIEANHTLCQTTPHRFFASNGDVFFVLSHKNTPTLYAVSPF